MSWINASLMHHKDNIHSSSIRLNGFDCAGRDDILSTACYWHLCIYDWKFELLLSQAQLNVPLSSPSPFYLCNVIFWRQSHPLPVSVRGSAFSIITSNPRTRERGRGWLSKCANERNCACSQQYESNFYCICTHTYKHKEHTHTHTRTHCLSLWAELERQNPALFSITIHHQHVWVVSFSTILFSHSVSCVLSCHSCSNFSCVLSLSNPFHLFFLSIVSLSPVGVT